MASFTSSKIIPSSCLTILRTLPSIKKYLMFLKRLLFCFVFLFFVVMQIEAQQETVISGRVTESGTNNGIPFVNIRFKGTFIGSVTDFEGNYSMKTTAAIDSIYVSLIGYKSKSKAVKRGRTQVVNFQLTAEAMNLNTIEVRPGVNPALRIIRNAVNNKSKYNRENLTAVQYVSYTKQEFAINNVTTKMRRRKFLHGVTDLWDKMDSLAGEDSKANLPVAMSEIISDIYSYKEGEKRHEDVNASKIKFVGMKDGSALQQLQGTDFLNYNFFNNNVALNNKDFLSPIADNANLFYNYYLIDSMFIDSTKCYEIKCRPKNKMDLAYTGTLWITDTTFAIKQLDLEITKDVNFNLVDHARIQQLNIPTEAGPWVPSQTRVLIKYSTQLKKFVALTQRTYNSNKYYVVNKPKEKDFYRTRITFKEDAVSKDTAWWTKERHEPLTNLEQENYNMIDTVRAIPLIKIGSNVMYFLFSGYKDVGPVDIGHYINIYGYNKYEGSRIQIGGRTNVKFSKDWIISGYGAYGFRDNGFKYNAQVEHILTRYPWSSIGIQYRDDIDQIGTTYSTSSNISLGQSPNNLYNTLSHIGNISKLLRKQEARIWYEKDFNLGLYSTITFHNMHTTPLYPVAFGDQFTLFQQKKYTISEILFETKYSVKEKFIQNGNQRISFGNNKSPVITLDYTLGIKHLLGGDFNYNKLSLSITNRFRMATLGYSQVLVKIGKVFSEVPYTLLEIPRGNQTSIYANNTYNIMNYFEFVSDQYIEAYWQHHFNGLFFNRIPLFKKLNWREVVGLNMAYGTLSDKNKVFNTNNSFTVMDDVPYFEADLGIENIFDFIRIDYLYRLTYNDDSYKADYQKANPGSSISNWGLKIGFSFSF